MQRFSLKQMTLRDVWKIFRRRMWLIILPLMAVIAVAVPGSFLLTPEYQASATLISKEVDEGSVLEGLVSVPLRPRERIQLVVQKIQSRRYMTEVATKANIEDYLRQKKQRPISNYDMMEYLNDIITVRYKGGDMVEISVNHEEPDKAMEIANTVASVYVDNALTNRQEAVSSSLTFIQNQLGVFKNRLQEAEQNLVDEQKDGALEALDKDSENLLNQLTKVETDMIEIDLNLQQAQEQLRLARNRLHSGASRPLQFTNPETLRLKMELASLNTQLTELQNKYSDDWPDVKKLKLEVAQKEAELQRAENKTSQNPQESTSAEIEYWQEEVKTLAIQKSTLENKIDDFNRRLQQLPQQQLNLARLTREQAAIEGMYSMLLQRQNNAILLQATELEQKGHVATVFDPAIRPERPIKPNKKKIAVMAIALGLMLGGGAAFLLEFFDHSFYSVNEVEEYLSLPVLGAVHKLNTYEGEIKDRRTNLLKLACAGAGGLMMLFLVIDLINFKFVTHNSQFLAIAYRLLSLMRQVASIF